MTDDIISPITGGFSSQPPNYPLGVPIKDKVDIREIDRRSADRVYISHHSYLPRGRKGWHYGVYFENQLVGAISFDAWPSNGTIRGYESEDIHEVSRVCIAHDTPNVASCAMSKTQDKHLRKHDDIKLLVTYVREDYDGSMFAALKGKGWEVDGVSEGHPPGNREKHDIHDYDKTRWVCEVSADV